MSADVPVTKETAGSARPDGKRLDGLTVIQWQRGKPLSWDVTVAHTLADSHGQWRHSLLTGLDKVDALQLKDCTTSR